MLSNRRSFSLFLGILFVSQITLSAVAQLSRVEKLRQENRLPAWANYVCYMDAKNIDSGWFMLIAYQTPQRDPFFPNGSDAAKSFGYMRGLTYQEYIDSDTGISPINMPPTPTELADALRKAQEGQAIPRTDIDMFSDELADIHNEIAVAKHTQVMLESNQSAEVTFLKDPLSQALLDAPDGTLFQKYLSSHPDFNTQLLYSQKYLNAGKLSPAGGVKDYLEGNLAFERDYGSGVFGVA